MSSKEGSATRRPEPMYCKSGNRMLQHTGSNCAFLRNARFRRGVVSDGAFVVSFTLVTASAFLPAAEFALFRDPGSLLLELDLPPFTRIMRALVPIGTKATPQLPNSLTRRKSLRLAACFPSLRLTSQNCTVTRRADEQCSCSAWSN